MQLEQLQALYQVIDTSWGKSGSTNKNYSVKFKLDGTGIVAMYSTILNCGNERELVTVRQSAEQEASKTINAIVAKARSECKKSGTSISTLKDSKVPPSSSVEMITPAMYNPKRTVIFRYTKTYTL